MKTLVLLLCLIMTGCTFQTGDHVRHKQTGRTGIVTLCGDHTADVSWDDNGHEETVKTILLKKIEE